MQVSGEGSVLGFIFHFFFIPTIQFLLLYLIKGKRFTHVPPRIMKNDGHSNSPNGLITGSHENPY